MKDSLGRVSSRDLTRDFFRQSPGDPVAWVQARDIPLLGAKAIQTLEDLYYEAGWLGWASARALVSEAVLRQKADANLDVNWGDWTPGDAVAARKLMDEQNPQALRQLLDDRRITIKGIEETRYKELASILAAGVNEGASMDTVAGMISAYLGKDMAWADTVARTETRAAVTAASIDAYRDSDVTEVEWLVAWDEACDTCQGFADLGPVPVTGGFDGLDGPPGHPNCLCVILPVVGAQPEAGDVDAVAEDEVVGGSVPQPLPSWESMPLDERARVIQDDFMGIWQPVIDQHGLEVKSVTVRNLDADRTIIGMSLRQGGADITYERIISFQHARVLNVEHAYFQIDPRLQGSGIATDINNAAFDLYKARGMETVTVHANIDVGGYTWAKQGFIWDERSMVDTDLFIETRLFSLERRYPDDQEVLDQVNEMRMRILSARQTGDRDIYPQPIDLAMIGHQPGLKTWPGKDEMLGTNWYGIRYL